MNRDELLALADRVEALTRPDCAIDVAIFQAIGAPVPFQFASLFVALEYDETERAYYAPLGDMRVGYTPPAYTQSTDVAATLLPEGFGYVIWNVIGKKPSASVQFSSIEGLPPLAVTADGWSDWSKGSTPAIALTAAAIRAIAAQGGE